MAFKHIGIALLVPVLAWAGTPFASAHARLQSSYPAKNEVLSFAPKSAWLLFNEEILTLDGKAKNFLFVMNSSRQRVDRKNIRVEKSKISVDIAGNLKPGKYQLRYRVVSADGHALQGSIGFTYKP
jgi:methionine-rich copper-binding protein CopC